MNSEIKFTKTDCWILLSIPNKKDGGLLCEVVGMSDALNHAFPTERELLVGLTKGLQAGFIVKVSNRFHYTAKFKQLHAEVFNSKGGLFSKVEILNKLLKKSTYVRVNNLVMKFASKEYKKACWEYSEYFWNRAIFKK